MSDPESDNKFVSKDCLLHCILGGQLFYKLHAVITFIYMMYCVSVGSDI